MKGRPKNGVRKTYAWYIRNGMQPPQNIIERRLGKSANVVGMNGQVYVPSLPVESPIEETDAEIASRIKERFEIVADMVDGVTEGDVRALIVAGPPGVGKTHLVSSKLDDYDADGENVRYVKGFVRATGLFKSLYACREEGQVLVLDDADSVFFDETSLNLLKACLDSGPRRTVSWLSQAEFVDDEGEVIPNRFEFLGTVIFITNYDFDAQITKGTKLAPHMSALLSRAHYIDLGMKSRRDCLVRIVQVIGKNGNEDVINFLQENISKVRELSIRTAIKIQALRRRSKNWQNVAIVTTCKL